MSLHCYGYSSPHAEFATNLSVHDFIHVNHREPEFERSLIWARQIAEGVFLEENLSWKFSVDVCYQFCRNVLPPSAETLHCSPGSKTQQWYQQTN